MKHLLILIFLVLGGCEMTAEEMAEDYKACKAAGLDAVERRHNATNNVYRVQCVIPKP